MSYYKLWIPQNNYYYSVENCGFSPNPERSEGTYSRYASLDDSTDGVHWLLGYIKFGLGRASYDASQEVRCGKITREEAVSLVKKYDGEFPDIYFHEILNYLDIEPDHFHKITDKFRPPHLWKKLGKQWKLKHTVNRDGYCDYKN